MINEAFDEYRVTLFKKKIRAVVPGGQNIRFERSVGRVGLIIDIWRYGRDNRKNATRILETSLRKAGIEYEIRGMFREEDQDYFAIPIDQAALPERVRAKK